MAGEQSSENRRECALRSGSQPIRKYDIAPFSRRTLLTTGIAALASGLSGGVTASVRIPDHLETVRRAFLFGFPVFEMVRTKYNAHRRALRIGRPPVNFLGHRAVLSDHTHRVVTSPNNDTLYSGGWLDLRFGPVDITIPPLSRYHSLALLDLMTDNFAILRNDSDRPRHYRLIGPGWSGGTGGNRQLIIAPTNDVWAIWRVLVRGLHDLDDARIAQRSIMLQGGDADASTGWDMPIPESSLDPENFLRVVNAALARSPMRPEWMPAIASSTGVGLDPAFGATMPHLSVEVRTAWERLLPQMHHELATSLGRSGEVRRGWLYPASGLGDFGDDNLYRSRVALSGLGALPTEEAVYPSSITDACGGTLSGRHRYRFRITQPVPVEAFWSLSMYQIEPDGRQFFVENELNRFSVGSFTPAITERPGQVLDIRMQTDRPRERNTIWLPAPSGDFRLIFRAYLPGDAMKSGSYQLAGVEPLENDCVDAPGSG